MTKERMPKKHRVGETKMRVLKTDYWVTLPDFTVPEPGRYRIRGKVQIVECIRVK